MIKNIKSILLEKIIPAGMMLDLGAGGCQDSLIAAEAGFHVVAVDKKPPAAALENPSVTFVQSPIEEFDIEENKYDLIYADNSLPFLTKDDAKKIIQDAAHKLKTGGLLYFSLFGTQDEWSDKESMNFWTKEEITDFVDSLGLTLYKKIEEEGYGPKMDGSTKYWHIFRFYLKR
jgi:SAM-dependent methyltransferase